MSDTERGDDASGGPTAIVLDFLAHGRTEDDRPQYQKQPLAYALDREDFRLYEVVLGADADVSIGDDLVIDRASDAVERTGEVEYEGLSGGAQSELDYAVEDLVTEEERRFVDFYNDAQPITLRLHQLNLLPGIGKKLRNSILDERKRGPFESFEDLGERVDGLHNPEEVIVERILEEIREDDLKYRTFARHEDEE
jgi:putative nucleotide binding protein